ncbi:MAG: hypothetical protein E7392_01875 [Ruminococcaceae bacterium]|nr:hypothetical protein [Oscillospiraceae bacterium]
MFLGLLNEKEGKNFLELASIAMNVDGEVVDQERKVFSTYRFELGLEKYEIKNKEYKNIVRELKSSRTPVLRAIIIELAGMMDADEEIEKVEENWLLKLGADFDFRDSEMRKMIRWTQDFNDLLAEGYMYINK